MTFLKWAFRYHSLAVDEFDSLEAAARSAEFQADAGNEALQGVEDTENGRWYDYKEVMDIAKPFSDAEYERYKNQPKTPYHVQIRVPPGDLREVHESRQWTTVEWEQTSEAAEAKAASWRALIGEDRVRIKVYQ